jgi:DNA repair protein RadC
MITTQSSGYKLADRDLLFGEQVTNNYVLRVKDLPDDERPREKLQELGPQALSVAELLAVIWGVGSKKEDVLTMASRTVKEYGERTISSELQASRLAEAADIPLSKAGQVVAAFELGRRYYATAAGRPVHIRNAKQAFQHLKTMGHLQKEQLRGLYVNSRYQVIYDEVISIGSLTSNVVHPREVFQPAIERGAVAVIIAHNHPSGSLEPTLADIQVTEQLEAAGEVLGIELLDHLIIAQDRFVSIRGMQS